jgi:hypothetical protein
MTRSNQTEVVLATPDEEVGIVPFANAIAIAKDLAKELKVTITIRNAVTDTVIKTVRNHCSRSGGLPAGLGF